MIERMHREEEKTAKEIISPEDADTGYAPAPPTAYIPACGTLCDAFWWARRSADPKKSSS